MEPDWDGVTPAAWRRALVLGEIAPWAVCKAVEWWALALARDAAWVCPVVACPVCRAEWRALDAAVWACPVVAWAQARRWLVAWAADSVALPWVGPVDIPVAGWEEPPWADSAARLWVEGSVADSAADSAAGSAAAAAWVEAAAAVVAAAVIAEKTVRCPS